MISEKIDVHKLHYNPEYLINMQGRLPDPYNIFKVPDRAPAVLFDINYMIILLIIISIFLILIICLLYTSPSPRD